MKFEISTAGALRGLRALFFEKRLRVNEQGEKKVVQKFSWGRFWKIWLAVGFGLFIIEESFQTTMFSVWPLTDAGRFDLVANRIPVMRGMNTIGRVLNYTVGWTNPLMFVAYHQYFGPGKAGDQYIASLVAITESNGKKNLATVAPATPVQGVGNTPLPDVPNFGPKPAYPGAIDCTETGPLVGFTRTVIVPVTSVRHLTTKKGGPMVICATPTNFTLVAWDQAICDKADALREKWVVVSGELVAYEGTVEIILNSWSQVLQVSELLAAAE